MAFATAQEAEQAFYRAFAAADFNAMKAVWAPQDITCIHPGGALLQEPETIFQSWQHILSTQGAAELRVEVLYRQARKDHVIHVVREHFRNLSNRPAIPGPAVGPIRQPHQGRSRLATGPIRVH